MSFGNALEQPDNESLLKNEAPETPSTSTTATVPDPPSTMSALALRLPYTSPSSAPRGALEEAFANLPTELRVGVWKKLATQPRLIH